MSIHKKSDGTRVTKATFPATPVTDPDPKFRVTQALVERIGYARSANPLTVDGSETRIAFPVGAIIRQSQIDALFPPPTITSVSPATGGVAGNTTVTIKGTGLDGATAVTFGGAAGTALTVVDRSTVTVKTPAHAAGAVDVVVTADGGTGTKTGGFTYS